MALNNEIDLTVEQIPQNPIILTPTDSDNYNDLTNKPKINGFILEDNKSSSQLGLASLRQGEKADSALQPGNNITALLNDAGYITKSVDNLDNYTKTSSLATVATTGAYSDLTGTPTLATVATSGDYDDLSDKPSVMVGADGVNAGASGFVPAPSATDNDKFLKGDGTWAGAGSGKSIGEVFYSQSSSAQDNPGALPLFTGETISNADQVYPEFYAWVADHANLQISAADYETALTTYGECPKYVIDTTNKTIRLPKLANYLKMANTTDGIAQAGAGLPNIYTEIATRKYESGVGPVASVTGAGTFENDGYPAASNVYTRQNGSSSYALQKSTIDASVGNSIYGNSNTVTPAHTTLFPWVCAYNAAVPASTAQAAQFQAALSSKADTNLGNCTKPYVTETYVNGESWYRIWSDGWCEQGGRITGTSITFLQSFVNTNYSFSGVSINSNSGGAASTVTNLTTAGCTYYTYGNAGGMWQACGYIR